MRKASFAITAIAVLVLGARTAPAQPTSQATPSLRHGVERLVAGDSMGALTEFQLVYDQTHSAVALAQMGLAEQALERWVEAEGHIRAALAARGDPWIERQRDALDAAYATILQHMLGGATPGAAAATATPDVVVQSTRAPPTLPTERVSAGRIDRARHRRLLPLVTGIGAAVILGVGFAGIAMRESVVTAYNANCRGFGDPSPTNGCDETTNASRANAAGALGVTGLLTGGLLGIITALLVATPSSSRPGLSLRCGGGPGDVGISCGGVL